jgi:hypothetical protein
MKEFINKYFLSSTTYLAKYFTISLYLIAIVISIKWYKTLGLLGGILYLIIAVISIGFVYNRLVNKKLK